jgi:hypothetical protein
MFITVLVKNVYGNDLVYPVDDAAGYFAALVGAKTFGARHLSLIKLLGYEIRVLGKLPFSIS